MKALTKTKREITAKLLKYQAATILSLLFAAQAHAGATSGGLPWEEPLKKVSDSLTGPVALAIALIAFTVAGATLVFGGELSEFARRAVMVVMAVSFLVLGASFVTTLFGVSGAVIA